MKDYLLTIKNTDYSFIVSAKDAKDAIQTLWEKITAEDFPMSIIKTDLQARSLGSLHTEYGKIIDLHPELKEAKKEEEEEDDFSNSVYNFSI